MMRRFVRLDRRVGREKLTEDEFHAHLHFLEQAAEERSMMAGGFVGAPGGMVVFYADSMEEAEDWAHEDPLFATGKYDCQIFEWHLVFNT
jgi:uncharacterized protein YciI